MYHFPNDIDWDIFFRFDKRLIENMNWAHISPAAKAIFPVIACHCDKKGVSFPGEETISALSGLTPKSVRKGIKNDLDGFPSFTWSHYQTRYGKRSKRFKIEFPQNNSIKGRTFFFYRGIIDSGIWRELKPTAQALYPVMRYFSRYDVDEDESIEDTSDFDEHFKNRQWELCGAEVGQLCKYAGINRRSFSGAIQSLEKNFLIEDHVDGCGEKLWKVYLRPKKYWKASYLNQKLRNKVVA